MFRELEKNKIEPCIKLKPNAAKSGIALRDNLVWRRRFIGESEEERVNYKKRWGIERVISVIKRLFGVKLAIVNVFMLVMRGLIN